MTMHNNMCKEGSNMLIYSQFTTNLKPCNFGYYVIWHSGAAVWQVSLLSNMIQCLTGLICVIRSLPRLNIQDFTPQHLDLLLTLQWLNYGSMQLSDECYSFYNERDMQCIRVRVRAVRDCHTLTSAIPAGPHSDGSPRSSDRRAAHSSSITSWTMTEAPEPLRSSLSPIWRYFSSSLVRLFLSRSTHRWEENKKKHTIMWH